MRNTLTKRFLSLVMALAMIVGLTAVVPEIDVAIKASAANKLTAQQIVDRANYMYSMTWTSKKTFKGYKSSGGTQYYFYSGQTYRIPYGMLPKAIVGYGISPEGFINATKDANNIFYNENSRGSYGNTSCPHYALDCSAFVSYCWGLSSVKTTNGLPGVARENFGFCNSSSINKIQIGDALNCDNYNGCGDYHVVLVTAVNYSSGSLQSIDIIEETPPQMKKSTLTRDNLIYGRYKNYKILRYADDSTPPALTDGQIVTDLGDSFTATIKNANSGKYVANISDDAKQWSSNNGNTAAVQWDFTKNSDGSYTISSNIDHKVLDAYGAGNSDYTNVFLWNNENSKNQKWFIHRRSDGKYYFRPSYSDSLVLDVCDASKSNDANVQLFTYNATGAQLFYIDKQRQVADLGKDFYALILNTDCWQPIVQANSGNVCLGRERSPCPDGTTVVKNANYDRTLWHFVRNNDDGSYIIRSVYNNYCLKVSPDSNSNFEVNGNNVKCYNGDGSTKAQRWFIIRRPDSKGGFTLRPLITSKVLDLTGNKSDESTNIEVWESHDGEAQRFSIYQLDKNRDKLSYKISADKKTVQQNQKTNISISGTLPYVYKFKIHVIDPDNKETVTDNGPSPVYAFSGSKIGKYVVYAEAISPLYTNSGSATKKCVTINVTCAHSITSTPAKAATCTANGNTAYWYCSNCKKYFSDKNCTKEITKASTVIAKTGHKATAYAAKPATCTANGNIAYWYCSNCKKYFSDKNCTKEITKASTVIAKTGHKTTATAAKAAACTTDGNIAYWYCSNCKKYFSDKNCTKEITKASTVIAKTGHKYVTTVVPPTCTEKGYTLHKCSVCGDEYKDNETSAQGHKYTSSVTKKASCTEDGTITYTCDCGDSYTETIKAAGHKYETTTVPPTDTEAGYDEHICSVCGDSYKDNIIPANGHSYTSEITKPASCTEDGLKIFTCTSCGDTYTEPIKATGHEYVSTVIPPDCTSDGYTVHICKKCNDSYTDERIKATGHKYVDTVIAPTTTEQGYTHHKCSVCGDEFDDSFVDPIKEEVITLDIILNANDQAMSSESISISIDGEASSSSENGKASLALADGSHEITFSAYGFVSRTYTVEVKDGQLTEELTPELNLIGDADGNGVINTLDIVKLKRHIINIEPLTGYALDCANTDGNDTVNTLDIVKLKRHLINVETLW